MKVLARMPNETVIDGDVVSLDEDSKPSFNTLQNYGSAGAPLHFFTFDVLILKGKDVMGDRLMKRRELIEEHTLPKLANLFAIPNPRRYSQSAHPVGEGTGIGRISRETPG